MSLRDYLFHEEPGITLYCGDCREVMPLIREERGAAGVVIADPPYGETALDWDVPVSGWLPMVEYATAPPGSLWCFGSMRFFIDNGKGFDGWRIAQDVVWEKHNGSGFAADRFKRVHEHVVHFYTGVWAGIYKAPQRISVYGPRKGLVKRQSDKARHTGAIGNCTYTDDGMRLQTSILRVRSEHHRAEHPTQKPLGIIEPLVRYSCPPQHFALDPFSGAGSTLLAAKAVGVEAIGIEIDPKYCEIAVKRLRQEVLPLA